MREMKALALTQDTADGEFSVVRVPRPACARDTLLVKNRYVGVNKGDAIRRERGMFGPSPTFPVILGFEGVGEVVEVGSDVAGWAVGDKCAYLVPFGGFAEFTSVSEAQVMPIPPGATLETVAATVCIGLTAAGLLETAGLSTGDSVLVQGGTGSVGRALISLARRRGLRVIASVSDESRAASLQLPAEAVVLLDDASASEKVCRLSGGAGVAAVFDGLGKAACELSLGAVRPGGKVLYYGSASGHTSFPGLQILMKHLTVCGFIVFECSSSADLWSRMVAEYSNAVSSHVLNPDVTVFAAEQVMEVFREIDSRSSRGRYVLDVHSL